MYRYFSSFASCLLVFVTLASTSCTRALEDCFGGVDNGSYLDWVAEKAASYNTTVCYNATSSDATQGIAVHWKLDDENIYLAVAVRAFGWVGFGLSESGGMKGADVIIFESAKPGQLRDAHISDERYPIDDDCQDWVFVDARTDGGFLIFEGYRKLLTMDTQDHAIINDVDSVVPAQRIIAAWGDSETASYHGRNNTARGTVRFYGGGDELVIVHEKLKMQSDGHFDLLVPNHTLAAIGTDYVNFCFAWDPDVVSQNVPSQGSIAVIAAEILLRDEGIPYVHHADVYASTTASNQSDTCLPLGEYGYLVYSWAPGVIPFVLPDNVGYLMGPGDNGKGLQSFRIQVHYNNPDLIEDIVDNGGVRVYYSLTPREHELGIMAMGDALSRLEGVPIPAGVSQFDFVCDPSCSTLALDEPVTVIQEGFHMHMSGYAAAAYHIRDGDVIREAHVDFFDYDQAGK
jgi:DOMON domain/Copper type II ascorbate-dependent monooxygenase, N-terminal domain